MIFSDLAKRPTVQASRSDYVRDWLSGMDITDIQADSGEHVSAESALRVSVVNRGINVIAHALSSIPLVVYKREPNGGKTPAVDYPSYKLLHDRPNSWMTSFRWRHLMIVRAFLFGDGYCQLLAGPGGVSQLVPLEPTTTRPTDQLSDGKLVYVTRDMTNAGFGPERRLHQDEVFHLRGMSLDGKRGIPLPEMARNAIGLALSAEKHGSMFLRQGARFSGILSTEGEMEDDERKENEQSWQRAYGGANSSGMTPVLTGGLEYTPISANNRDAQWEEARRFQVEELLRFLGVPGVLVGYADKTSTYASAEQFFLSFVKDTVRPWTENFAAELNFTVVMDQKNYFAEFDLSELLKGDLKTRYSANQSAILAGWKSRQEVRREEHLDPGPTELETFMEPSNMLPAGGQQEMLDQNMEAADREAEAADADAADAKQQEVKPKKGDSKKPLPKPSKPSKSEDDGSSLAAIQFVVDTAARVVSRELKAIRDGEGAKVSMAVFHARKPTDFKVALTAWYEKHASSVASIMHISADEARKYANDQRDSILSGGVGVMTEQWERDAWTRLSFLSLGQPY